MKTLKQIIEESLQKNSFRMHPNGFYQLDLIQDTRLHIWPPQKEESQKNYNPIHDHTFSFKSLILLGCLIHSEYQFLENPKGKYQLYEVIPQGSISTIMKPTGKFVDIILHKEIYLNPGNKYIFEKQKFHESVNKEGVLTSTIMKKIQGFKKDLHARIIGIRDHDPEDNDFDRLNINQERARFYLNEVLENLNPEILDKANSFINQ